MQHFAAGYDNPPAGKEWQTALRRSPVIRAYLLHLSGLGPPHLQTGMAEHGMFKWRGFLRVPELLNMAAKTC